MDTNTGPNKIYSINGTELTLEQVCSQVGPGWKSLVSALITDLFKLGWDGNLHQIKEKFGGLRFYIGSGTEDMFRAIKMSEAESTHTCEECGLTGTIKANKRGWLKCLCEDCRTKLNV